MWEFIGVQAAGVIAKSVGFGKQWAVLFNAWLSGAAGEFQYLRGRVWEAPLGRY